MINSNLVRATQTTRLGLSCFFRTLRLCRHRSPLILTPFAS